MDSRTEDEITFIKAYAKMYKDLPLIGKKTDGYNYKYAALENILAEWEPVFDKHGFLLEQFTKSGYNGEWDVVGSVLTHIETGLFRECTLTLPVGADWQQTGSGVTYFKRYTVTALGKQPVGEDFDGLKDKPTKKPAKSKPAKKASKPNGSFVPLVAIDLKDVPDPSESGPHIAYEEFLQGCVNVTSIEDFYRTNKKELDKIKKTDKELYQKCISAFSERKTQLQKES